MSSRFGRKQKRRYTAWLESYEAAFKHCYGVLKAADHIIDVLKDKENHDDVMSCTKRAVMEDYEIFVKQTIEKYK